MKCFALRMPAHCGGPAALLLAGQVTEDDEVDIVTNNTAPHLRRITAKGGQAEGLVVGCKGDGAGAERHWYVGR